ncbi:MAG: DUF3379 family protein [Vicinamibacteraceae bacterium]
MECREVRELAEAFVSEQLLVETMRAVVAHLEHCPACREEIEGLRRLRGALRSAWAASPDLAPRPAFAAALRARLESQAAGDHPAAMSRRRWLAIAAGGALVAGAGWGWREWLGADEPAFLQAAVGDHRFCALTFKLAEPPISLDEAARRYGGVYARLEAIEPSATTLSGGPLRIVARHSCVFEGRRFAHLVLLYKNEKVSLLVTDDTKDEQAGPTAQAATNNFQVASMHAGRHGVFVVSSLDQGDVSEVAQALAEPLARALANA